MDSRRERLKELAARSARLWGLMPIPEILSGETRIETRNTVYKLRDGICYSVRRDDPQGRLDPTAFIGMRVVGWLWQDDPRSVLSLEWQPGAYAVLWRRGTGPGDRSAVALTSATVAFRKIAPSVPVRAAAQARPPPRLPCRPRSSVPWRARPRRRRCRCPRSRPRRGCTAPRSPRPPRPRRPWPAVRPYLPPCPPGRARALLPARTACRRSSAEGGVRNAHKPQTRATFRPSSATSCPGPPNGKSPS